MIEYTAEHKAKIFQAVENCLFTFNLMASVWPQQQNIDAARDSILSEIEHILELPNLGEEEQQT